MWQVATILDSERLGSIYNLQEIQGTEERVRTLWVCIQQKPDWGSVRHMIWFLQTVSGKKQKQKQIEGGTYRLKDLREIPTAKYGS